MTVQFVEWTGWPVFGCLKIDCVVISSYLKHLQAFARTSPEHLQTEKLTLLLMMLASEKANADRRSRLEEKRRKNLIRECGSLLGN